MFVTNIASAGFIVEMGERKIIMDPWLLGTGFIGGWAPLSFSDITDIPTVVDYLWISHEHPDHFSPPTLKALFKHFQTLPLVLFQETVDDRVINWFSDQGCGVQVLADKKLFKLNELEFRLQKFGLYDSTLQLRNKTECFTNLNDASVESSADLSEARAFAGARHHVFTSQYGIANSEHSVDDINGWKKTVEAKKRTFLKQVKAVEPDLCIPAASSVHFCAEDNVYMNKHRINPAIFFKGEWNFAKKTRVLLPLTSERVWTKSEKEIRTVNDKFEKYYDRLLKKTESLVLEKAAPLTVESLKKALAKSSHNIFKNNNRAIIWFLRPFGFLKDQSFYLTDTEIYVTASLWHGDIQQTQPCQNFVSISSEVLSKTYSSPYGADALIASGRYDLKNARLKSLLDHLSIIHINTAGIYFNFSILFAPRQLKALFKAAWSYLLFFKENRF